MDQRKRNILFFTQIILLAAGIYAGDVASFVDLGFSADGNTYLFGQYGVTSPALLPWADLYMVNVPANEYVKDGKFSVKDNNRINSGQNGSGALYYLLSKEAQALSKYGYPYLKTGVPLYIYMEEKGRVNSTVEFRDFNRGINYTAKVNATVESGKNGVSSSFYILMEGTRSDGVKLNYRIGAPSRKREGIASYLIKKILLTPDGLSMIFVIEMEKAALDPAAGEKAQAAQAPDIRYMVEAVKLAS
jgi:predicted secreted protein